MSWGCRDLTKPESKQMEQVPEEGLRDGCRLSPREGAVVAVADSALGWDSAKYHPEPNLALCLFLQYSFIGA